jgi:hypothetical protein
VQVIIMDKPAVGIDPQSRRHLISGAKPPSERDIQIYKLHKAGKTARQMAEMFGISESRVRAIYWAMKKQQSKSRQ